MVLEKEEARRTYDDIVGRRIDPALIEQVTRRVEFEYMQLLESHNGRLDYSFPLAPETDQPLQMELFVLRAQVRSQHAFEATTSGLPRLTEIDRPDAHHANIFFGDEQVKPREDFTLTIRQTDDRPKPTVLSFAPQPNDDLGYYALWLPPLPELTQGEPLPRSLTFVIDISSSMQQSKLQVVKGALIAAINGLDAADLFNIVVFTHRADSFAAAPVPADPANKKAATAFINQQDALGVSNFEAGLGRAMQQAFPANRVNHVIFLTDGLPTLGELDLELLSEMVGEWSAGQARLFTIGVGQDVDQGFLIGLAEEHRGKAYFLSEEGDIEAALQELFESFTFPVLLLDELSFDQVEIHDVHPRGVEALAAGRELFQVGRYRGGGTFTLSLTGHVGDESVSVDFPLEFAQTDVSGELIPRLWAYQKIQALEEQIARFGEQQELLDDILTLGLEYQLVTRRTSLFAPDDGVEVNPLPRFFDDFATTDINDARPTTHWLGRDFALEDEVWIDLAYQPGMPKELYEGRTYQPAELANFARLGQAMLVVVEERAYEIRANAQGSRPVLLQNAPNPFNASTVISFLIPFRLANEATRLSIYNLTGQLVRVIQSDTQQAGEHSLSWDGRDDYGREVASGVYIYRLDVGEWAVHRRMLLLR